MTAVLDDAATVPAHDGIAAGCTTSPAGWPARAGALFVDVVIGLLTVATLVVVAWSTVQRSWLWWLCVVAAGLVVLAIVVNRLLLPTVTGWSLGRALFGLRVLRRDGSAPGPWRLLVRDIAHLLDTAALFVGWLWPLWDSRHRTWADLLTGTEVHRTG
ncbi:MAG: rane protein, partial [Mycobacterium sp.]|nr:rane protein [Mycobacterium sp.]